MAPLGHTRLAGHPGERSHESFSIRTAGMARPSRSLVVSVAGSVYPEGYLLATPESMQPALGTI